MLENLKLVFDPHLPSALLFGVCAAIVALCAWSLINQQRGALIRCAAGAMLCLALFSPVLLEEEREKLPTIVPVVVDETSSQRQQQRQAQTNEALENLRGQFADLDNFELREIRARDRLAKGSDVSTALFSALNTSIQDIPKSQLGGTIFITDGQVHDVPEVSEVWQNGPPLHVLLTGKKNDKDRRIKLTTAPRFGVVGELQEIIYVIEETGFENRNFVDVEVKIDGELVSVEQALPGAENSFIFEVPHGGENIIELNAEISDSEISEINNSTFVTLNGIRENLRVLLVSGEPYSGERTWRNLLKSDTSVDLVHFTILRPPEKQDGTPPNELSLIPFPTRELFLEKIDEFDLIIFDRYALRGILPLLYFDNIARYVRDGGALLIAAGPEYATSRSIDKTRLVTVLPAGADGQVHEGPFRPQVSEIGRKHPVTRDLEGWNDGAPNWSRWFRAIGATQSSGNAIMEDEEGRPMLMLDEQGEGRVALFLSDHVWLWSRNFEGGGPHVQLLRRLSHWLMKEPELEAERLVAKTNGDQLEVTRQTLSESTQPVIITSPSGEQTELKLERDEAGVWSGSINLSELGLYQVEDGEFRTLAKAGPSNPRELSAILATQEHLKPIVEASSGSFHSLGDAPMPRIIAVSENGTKSGSTWMGVVDRDASLLSGVTRIPLFTGLLGLALLLAALSSMWYREGR